LLFSAILTGAPSTDLHPWDRRPRREQVDAPDHRTCTEILGWSPDNHIPLEWAGQSGQQAWHERSAATSAATRTRRRPSSRSSPTLTATTTVKPSSALIEAPATDIGWDADPGRLDCRTHSHRRVQNPPCLLRPGHPSYNRPIERAQRRTHLPWQPDQGQPRPRPPAPDRYA